MKQETPAFRLKSYEFRREREAQWRELEALVRRAENKGIKDLSAEELHRLPALYRSVLSSLSVARAISLDMNLLAYLESLAGRAYFVVYATRRSFFDAVGHFLGKRFPALLWTMRKGLLLSIALLALGTLLGYVLVMDDADRFYSFVGEGMAGGRTPASSKAQLYDALYDKGEDMGAALAAFASFLFTHNAKIGLACFVLGFAAGAPVVLLLIINGLTLGAFAALYARVDLGVDFWGWVLPHGVTELFAVCVCGAAGLALGHALVYPGRHGRMQNLAFRGRQAASVVVGAVLLFFIAALIEGFFRQMVTDIHWRYAVVALTSVLLLWYFGRGPRLARELGLASRPGGHPP